MQPAKASTTGNISRVYRGSGFSMLPKNKVRSSKNATAIQLADLQVGDRILVRATPSADGKSLAAATLIVMKRTDVEAKQQQEREDLTGHDDGSPCFTQLYRPI